MKALIPSILAATAFASAAHAQSFVQIAPYFWPDGRSQFPFHVLAAGVWAAPSGGQVSLRPGVYYEPQTISKHVTLTTTGGSATIGAAAQNVVPFKIASYNTHLFGQDIIPGLPRWKDAERAPYIGLAAATESADVFCMQEVWDPTLGSSIRIITTPTYPSGFYGGEIFGGSVLNSGLYTLSKTPISDPLQDAYAEEDGTFEALASKGYIRTTVVKNGVTVTVFNTHTQSGDSENNMEARASQLAQLGVSISIWRALHPTHVVIVVGDFNVIGLSAEYGGAMQSSMGNLAGVVDGAKNMPVLGNSDNCTSCTTNELREHFSPDEETSTRLDYILYANALDDSVRVVPRTYFRRAYQIPASSNELCGSGLCTRDLSDHYGVMMEFDLVRR